MMQQKKEYRWCGTNDKYSQIKLQSLYRAQINYNNEKTMHLKQRKIKAE